jgi:uncharacterized coiled-coil protein SlyX
MSRQPEEQFPKSAISDERRIEELFCQVAGFQRKQIERRAYQIFLNRGGIHGHDVDDWLQAQRELLGSLESQLAAGETTISHLGFKGCTPRSR